MCWVSGKTLIWLEIPCVVATDTEKKVLPCVLALLKLWL